MKLIKMIKSFIPSALPVGLTEFNAWADEIILLAGKFADEDSMKFVLASAIQHAGHTQAYLPKRHFVKILRKGAANQVSAQVFQDIKQKQAEAAALKQAEATASQQESAAVDVQPPQA